MVRVDNSVGFGTSNFAVNNNWRVKKLFISQNLAPYGINSAIQTDIVTFGQKQEDSLFWLTLGNITEKTQLLEKYAPLFKSKDFTNQEIINIITKVNACNEEFIAPLVEGRKDNGEPRFGALVTEIILEKITPFNKNYVLPLINARTDEGKFRFHSGNLSEILKYTNENNNEILPLLLEAKDENNKFRFSQCCIENILSKTTSQNREALKKLVNKEDNEGKLVFSPKNIQVLLELDPKSLNRIANQVE